GVVPDDLLKFLRELRPAHALAGNEIWGDFRAEGKTVRDAGPELAITRGNPATMRYPGFRTLNVAEDQIEFIYRKCRLACRLEVREVRAHFGKHGAIGIRFGLAQQKLFQNRHVKKLRHPEFSGVVAKQDRADPVVKLNVARKPPDRIERGRKRHDAFERDTAMGGAQADKTAEACRSANGTAGVGAERNVGELACHSRRRTGR